MLKRDPKPEIQRLEELALSVRSGEVKLPKFQRPFVWKQADILKLLDSIYKGYPIGSLLMWNSSQILTSERSILGIDLSNSDSIIYPTNYLLDGQQRLTALCGSLFWSGDNPENIWNIVFDLDREEFIPAKGLDSTALFPLNKLIDTGDFIRQCARFESHAKRDTYLRVAERLLRSFKDYKIAVVKIGDMTVEEVAPIFERINSTGRKLTIVDLMVAATWSNGFDLNDVIKEINLKVESLDFSKLKGDIILRSISAATGGGISKGDIQRLRKLDSAQLQAAAHATKNAVVQAIDFLVSRFKIRDLSRLPYAHQLTYLIEYFRIAGRESKGKEDELVRWIWFTSVTRYFASASNTGQTSRDLASIREFASGGKQFLYERRPIDISSLLFDRFNLRIATTTSFTLLLSSAKPNLSVDGNAISDAYLSVKDNRFYMPVLPEVKANVGYIIHPFSDHANPENIIRFEDHFLDEGTVKFAQRGDVTGFCAGRAKLIAALVADFTQCKVTFTQVLTGHLLDPDGISE